MRITGTHFNYYFVCKRKLWLFAHGINMEHVSDLVTEGRFIHEEAYPQRPQRYEEIEIEGIKVDFYDPKRKIIHEIKKSDSIEPAHEWQLKFYMYVFENNGITCSGILEYPVLRKTKQVILNNEDRGKLDMMKKEIAKLAESDICPAIELKKYCRKCSYFDFCFTSEPDDIL